MGVKLLLDKVEEKYAQLFVTNNGRPALPVRVA